MRVAFTIAAKDLRQRLRDRSAIILGFVAPVVIAFVMSMAFRGTETFHLNVGVVDLDHGALAAAFSQTLADPQLAQVVTAHPVATVAEAQRAVRDRRYQAAYVVPAGFTDAVLQGRPVAIDTLRNVNDRVGGDVAASIASGFAAQVDARRLAIATALQADPALDLAALQAVAGTHPAPVTIEGREAGTRPLKGISYYAPGMALFFLFFTIGFTARSWFADKGTGMLDRMRAAPVSRATVLAGKALSVLVFGTLSLLVMGVVTTVAFGADWGPVLPAAAISVAMVVAVMALTMLVIALARTERQADDLASIAVFGLALLGGNFVVIANAPAVVRHLALLTPNGWALRGFTDLSTGAGAGAAVAPVLAITAFCVVVGGIALLLGRRQEAV